MMAVNRLKLTLATAATFIIAGCQCIEDTISLTPLWWLNNRRVQATGSLHENAPVVTTVNYAGKKTRYAYRIVDGTIETKHDSSGWMPLPGGNPRGCNGKPLSAKLIAADNNRLFIMAADKKGTRTLWFYCVRADQAEWSKKLIKIGGDMMRKGYAAWTECAHKEAAWTNLLALRSFVTYVSPRYQRTGFDEKGNPVLKVEADNVPRTSIDINDIVDIAVGNWTGTVVTYYVLMGSTGKILYIDEEVVMDRWKVVPHLCKPCNDPYPLDSNSRIAASNSVICAWKKGKNTSTLSWIRWDFHNRQDFTYYPVDWCEHVWHTVSCPLLNADFLSINTHWPDSIRDTIWQTPKNSLTGKRNGFLGEVPRHEVSAYPISIDIAWADNAASLYLDNMDYKAEKLVNADSWKKRKLTSAAFDW